jgi:pimeloyl-ACP methyl ester carboxylesterase
MLRAFGDGLFGEQYGHGRAKVLALPGWMRPRSDFRHVLADLDAIALDLPGFGGASPEPAAPPQPLGAGGFVSLVAPVLEMCAPDVVVVGHSVGGRVAVGLAAAHPDRIGALVLTGVPRLVATEPAKGPTRRYRAARWLHRHGLMSAGRMEALRRRRGSTDYANASPTMRAVLVAAVNEDYEHQLGQLECPVELVWGDDDTAAPLAMAQQAADLLGERASLTVLTGAGHLTPLTAPDALRAAVTAHLA